MNLLSPIQLNLPIVTASVILATALGATIIRAFRIRQTVHREYSAECGRIKVAIDADHMIPLLAWLQIDIARRVSNVQDGHVALIDISSASAFEDALRSSGYVDTLERMGTLEADRAGFDRLLTEIEGWSKWKGICLLAAVPGFVYVLGVSAFQGAQLLLGPAVLAGVVIAFSLLTAAACWAFETGAENGLVKLLRKYP